MNSVTAKNGSGTCDANLPWTAQTWGVLLRQAWQSLLICWQRGQVRLPCLHPQVRLGHGLSTGDQLSGGRSGLCPDCGLQVMPLWAIAHCARCGVRQPLAWTAQGLPGLVHRFCHRCGLASQPQDVRQVSHIQPFEVYDALPLWREAPVSQRPQPQVNSFSQAPNPFATARTGVNTPADQAKASYAWQARSAWMAARVARATGQTGATKSTTGRPKPMPPKPSQAFEGRVRRRVIVTAC